MSFRETPGYTPSAIGAGDFFKNHGRQELRDADTNELRYERTWLVERVIDVYDVGKTVEFGEKTAVQIAKLLGYVSKSWHNAATTLVGQQESVISDLKDEILRLKDTNQTLIVELAEIIEMDMEL